MRKFQLKMLLSENIIKLNNEEVEIKVIHKAVGMVTESDVLLAEASNAVIVGFGVQVSSNAKLQASQAGVDIRIYNVIYNVVDEIKLALEGLLELLWACSISTISTVNSPR